MTKFNKHHTKAAKLTPSQVFELREKYSQGQSQGSLAREYQVSVGQIGRIVRGESWQQYTNPAEIKEPVHVTTGVSHEPSEAEIQASFEKLQRMLGENAVDTKVKSDLDEFLTDSKEERKDE